ncbi:protein ABHD15 [Latimeria chalumnae]|uniref:protein ABHD15 n=1 Tax=Latimeria chalumnae TaxID=7897 RepID=UPI00313E5E5A
MSRVPRGILNLRPSNSKLYSRSKFFTHVVAQETKPNQGRQEEEDKDFGYSCQRDKGLPSLICKQSALAKYLLQSCKTFSAFDCSNWIWSKWAHLQTIYNVVLPREKETEFSREYLQLADGGIIALDWAVRPWTPPKTRRATGILNFPPVLLIIPNSFGKMTRNLLHLCKLALDQGYYPVVFNRRGQNNCPLSSVKLQQFGDPSDLKEAVAYICFRHPNSMLFAVSEGLGSGLLLSYLGECGSSSYLTCAVCISPVFRCQEWFESGLNWLYKWILLLYQKFCLCRYTTALGESIKTEKLFQSGCLWEFEELLFCQTKENPISWDVYWERNDPLRDVDEVAIPVLCICSQEDPIRGPIGTMLPMPLFETNPYFFLLLTRHGGHCGFFTAPSTAWSNEAALEYFKAVPEFFKAEEKLKSISRRRSSIMLYKQRKGMALKQEPPSSYSFHNLFNWQRSYTR